MLPDIGMGKTETRTGPSPIEVAEVLDRLDDLIDCLQKSRELINAKEAADFLRLPYTEFKRLAPTLPRHAVTSGATSTAERSSWSDISLDNETATLIGSVDRGEPTTVQETNSKKN